MTENTPPSSPIAASGNSQVAPPVPTAPEPLLFFDRSRVQTDGGCRRARYYLTEYENRGIVLGGRKPLYFIIGDVVHACLDDMSKAAEAGVEVDIALLEAVLQPRTAVLWETLWSMSVGEDEEEGRRLADETSCLVEGLIRGFHRHMWPLLIRDYDIIGGEREIIYDYDIDGQLVRFGCRPDLLARKKDGGGVWYFEYKTPGSLGRTWFEQWTTAIQLQAGAWATGRVVGEEVEGAIVQALYKGDKDRQGRSTSPFTYCYYKPGNPPFTAEQFSQDYKPAGSGWTRRAVYTLPGGCEAQVRRLSGEVLAAQFPQSPPVFLNEDLVRDWLRQTALRELEIKRASEELRKKEWPEGRKQRLMDTVFRQNFDTCTPYKGSPCQYRHICHGGAQLPTVENEGVGMYVWRQPHHTTDPLYQCPTGSAKV